jgi:Uma2 family endonuclease
MTLDKRLDDSAPHQAKLTARDFWLLADSGAFANHARTELIEGEIWVVNSVHRWHARAMVSLSVALMEAIKAQGLPLEVLSAGSVSMSDDSVPEPDLSVIVPYDPDADTIGLNELKLAVEISDSTAEFDLGRKAELYARHGVPEYWVFRGDSRQAIQLWSPTADGYAERRIITFGERIEAVTIEGLAIETSGI